jgi:hypothetical protein
VEVEGEVDFVRVLRRLEPAKDPEPAEKHPTSLAPISASDCLL